MCRKVMQVSLYMMSIERMIEIEPKVTLTKPTLGSGGDFPREAV